MELNRRGFFGLLAGLVVCPLTGRENRYAGPIEGYNRTFHYRNFICDDVVSSGNLISCEEMAKLLNSYHNNIFLISNPPKVVYWPKESA